MAGLSSYELAVRPCRSESELMKGEIDMDGKQAITEMKQKMLELQKEKRKIEEAEHDLKWQMVEVLAKDPDQLREMFAVNAIRFNKSNFTRMY